MSIVLDADAFQKRISLLWDTWKAGRTNEEWAEADAIVFPVGKSDEEIAFQKGIALQTWLFGYEFPETIIALTADKILILTSEKKARYIEPLAKRVRALEIIKRTKDEAVNKAGITQLINALASSHNGKKIGVIAKDRYQGQLIKEWQDALKSGDRNFEEADVSAGVATVLAVKDEDSLRNIRQAAKLSSMVMKKYFVNEMMDIIDEGKQIKHDKLSAHVEDMIHNEDARKKYKFPTDLDYENVEFAYSPIIQSGGKFDLRASAVSNNETLHEGTIICSVGVRYKSYCSSVARTYMMDPEKSKEKNYLFLLELQEHVLRQIRHGVACKDVYNAAVSYIESKRPDLKDHFLKNCGWSVGIEFRESNYTLGPKHTAALQDGMVINLILGFQNLKSEKAKDARSKTYALLLTDTILVTKDSPTLLTDVKKTIEEVSFEFQDDEAADVSVKAEKKSSTSVAQSPPSGRQEVKARRTRDDKERQENEARRAEHQRQLHAKLQLEGTRRFQNGDEENVGEKKEVFKKFASYKSETSLPKQVQDLKVLVDRRNESIILPIYGLPVPFHVSTLKNVSKSDEQDYVYLRFNFVTPGAGGKKESSVPFEDPSATFVRALTFRSADVGRFNEIFREINELKKETAKREAERKQMADLVEQDKLVEIRNRRPLRLPEVYVRPQVDKRGPGDLEIHSNGLRYQGQLSSGNKIDILFSNIKHFFFQPCDHELIVILHVHLKNPIMIGKKKTRDVQFYRDVAEAGFDETGGRRRRPNYGDEDELAQEQEERRRRALLNKEFKAFAEKIQDASRIDVDMPYRDLGYMGVFSRQLCLLQPTNECLVHLTDVPNFVLTLSEVELVHLERVQFHLKNFDMVFIFKDYSRPVVHINTIPVKQLENIKEWLDSCEIPFTQGPANLVWPQIMKTVVKDPQGFFETGGWNFLTGDEEDESEESASEFEMDESDFDEDDDESEEYESGGEAESAYSGSDDGEDDESEGEDWDELERRAAKADARRGSDGTMPKKRRGDSDDDEDDRRPKKRR
ncbi:FACT complex subunit spt16 [Gaertneriomyces sp. JEL0708]|nr:FACT complex subunit spt16 [Gaertneriomyces sp. JEL0708]